MNKFITFLVWTFSQVAPTPAEVTAQTVRLSPSPEQSEARDSLHDALPNNAVITDEILQAAHSSPQKSEPCCKSTELVRPAIWAGRNSVPPQRKEEDKIGERVSGSISEDESSLVPSIRSPLPIVKRRLEKDQGHATGASVHRSSSMPGVQHHSGGGLKKVAEHPAVFRDQQGAGNDTFHPPLLLPGMTTAAVPAALIRQSRKEKAGSILPTVSDGTDLQQFVPKVPEVGDEGVARVVWGASWAVFALVVMWVAQLAQERLASRGILPFLVRQVARLSGVLAVLFAMWGSVALLPKIPPEVLWGTMAAVVLLMLVAARGLLPDVLAGMLIVSERRIADGMAVEGEGFSGTVVGTGWRCTILRTPRGLLEIPNRKLLAGPLRTTEDSEHELVLRLRPGLPADETRCQIEDVVLSSAWTPPNPETSVRRDPCDPHRWSVRTRLLEPRFASFFDAELPERLERRLAIKDDDAKLVVPSEAVDASTPSRA